MDALNGMLQRIGANRDPAVLSGVYSICSANPHVIRAGLRQAKKYGSIVIFEGTSNQFNQFGGYTGKTPADFVSDLSRMAQEEGVDWNQQVVVGGDHLGTLPFAHQTADEAMGNAIQLGIDFMRAGARKIHLDLTTRCKDDAPMSPEQWDKVIAQRAAIMCKAIEDDWKSSGRNGGQPLYIVGSEVPPAGGAHAGNHTVKVTDWRAAQATIENTKAQFVKLGLEDACSRIIGVVVDPGVEFGPQGIFHFKPGSVRALSSLILRYDNVVWEAHSTDYQNKTSLRGLVQAHWGILKVGPWLTFAMREALYGLEQIERVLVKKDDWSNLFDVVDDVMVNAPPETRKYWDKYYKGSPEQQKVDRVFNFADRIRYFWPNPNVQLAMQKLFRNLRNIEGGIRLDVLDQFLPGQFGPVGEKLITADPEELILNRIQRILEHYDEACGFVPCS
jgi:D-tagatose-1,6-bisphosphate aldolase subunit GatZ/KbaZ